MMVVQFDNGGLAYEKELRVSVMMAGLVTRKESKAFVMMVGLFGNGGLALAYKKE